MKNNQIKIWDSHNKQYLEPMSILFGKNNEISKIVACVPDKDPLVHGYYNIEGKDLKKISIIGSINLNPQLMPSKIKEIKKTSTKKKSTKNKEGESFFNSWDKVIKGIKL